MHRGLLLGFAVAAAALLYVASGAGFGNQRVMVEVHFDLALNQESETGYTAAHTVSEYLEDENLLWMRYFHTLASGQAGVAPMRVALMEFKDVKGWAAFEQAHLDGTHILYDLFWINWRRQLWYELPEDADTTPISKPRDAYTPSGFVWAFRYSAKNGKQAEVDAVWKKHGAALKAVADANPRFLEARAYTARGFQSEYQHLMMWEFGGMADLAEVSFNSAATKAFLHDLIPLLDKYFATVLVPSTDNQGGQIFAGKGARLARKGK